MFKNVISPVQAWLLSQGRCVGCGTDLSTGKVSKHDQGEKIVCPKCGRIFIKESMSGKYRRALFEEV
jgi:predicted  nucleic acid-binding Zn-ribbon protein